MPLSPEQKLAFAVLLQGLRDMVLPAHGGPSSHSDHYPATEEVLSARIWVEEERDYICSLTWCCGALNIDADRVRKRILTWWRDEPDRLRAAIDELEIYFDAQSQIRTKVECTLPLDWEAARFPSQKAPSQLTLFT